MGTTTWDSLVIGAVGGLAAAAFTQIFLLIKEWVIGRNKNKREATYLAMRLAVLLEGYAIACRSVFDMAEADANQHRSPSDDRLPKLEPYPSDGDWKSLNIALANNVLSFQNEVEKYNSEIIYRSVQEGDKFSIIEKTANLTVISYNLATKLRRKYNISVDNKFIEKMDKFKENNRKYMGIKSLY